jgi:hypothetical protein
MLATKLLRSSNDPSEIAHCASEQITQNAEPSIRRAIRSREPIISGGVRCGLPGFASPTPRGWLPLSDHQAFEVTGRVARAGGGPGRENLFERVLGIGGNSQPGGRGILFEPLDMAGAGDRHDKRPP